MCKWYLIFCKANQDSKAERNLVQQGFDVFRPVVPKYSGDTLIKEESLFPRYLFLNANAEVKSLRPVSSTYGVSNFVKFGDDYAIANDHLIDEIKTVMEEHSQERANKAVLRKGDSVLVDSGSLDQLEAVFCNPCGNERAMILINILGRQSKMNVPMKSIRKV